MVGLLIILKFQLLTRKKKSHRNKANSWSHMAPTGWRTSSANPKQLVKDLFAKFLYCRFLLSLHFISLIYAYVCVCLSVCMCTNVQTPVEARRGRWMWQSWGFTGFCGAQHGFWKHPCPLSCISSPSLKTSFEFQEDKALIFACRNTQDKLGRLSISNEIGHLVTHAWDEQEVVESLTAFCGLQCLMSQCCSPHCSWM